MTHRTALACLVLLTGCAPITQGGPSNDPDPDPDPDPQSLDSALRCATAAWAAEDTYPVAIEVEVDRLAFSAQWTLDRAFAFQADGAPATFDAETWTSQASFEAGDVLSLTLDGLTIEADRLPFADGMWEGALVSDVHGEHDVVCWEADFVGDFSYEAQSGTCRDESGAEGLNALPVPYVRAAADGQCGTFAGLSLNEDFLVYPVLRADLRGAVLEGATLFFADMLDSQWEGADLTGFEFGYALLSGSTDVHTVWPEGPCTVDDGVLDCMQ